MKWNESILRWAKTDLRHNRGMALSYVFLVILNIVCVILNCVRVVLAIAAGAIFWPWIISAALWTLCVIGNLWLTIHFIKEWRKAKAKVKELENE